jgi:HEAT repeat protein
MDILSQLSSQVGDRTEDSNKRVAGKVLKDPALLKQLEEGLASNDFKLAGDCAEVMTNVAAENPELVVPFADSLIRQIEHKDTRVRWESMHSLAEIGSRIPNKISAIVPKLAEITASDKSVIVRGYAIKVLGEYGMTSPTAAHEVWPPLVKQLDRWEEKDTGKVLESLFNLVSCNPGLSQKGREIAKKFQNHASAKARTMAKRLLKK